MYRHLLVVFSLVAAICLLNSCKIVDGTGFKGYGAWQIVEYEEGQYRLEIEGAAWGLRSRSYTGFVGIQLNRKGKQPLILYSESVQSINGQLDCGLLQFIDTDSYGNLNNDKLNRDGNTSYSLVFFKGTRNAPQVTCEFRLAFMGLKRGESVRIVGGGKWYVLKSEVLNKKGKVKYVYRPYVENVPYKIMNPPFIGSVGLVYNGRQMHKKVVDTQDITVLDEGVEDLRYTWSNEDMQLSEKHWLINARHEPKYELVFRDKSRFGKRAIVEKIQLEFGGIINEPIQHNQRPIAENADLNMLEDGSLEFSLKAEDEDGDDLQYEILAEPGNGSALIASNGNLKYVPSENFHGLDELTFRVFDGIEYSDPGKIIITIEPVNDAPVLFTKNFETNEDQTLRELIGATDVDGDVLKYEIGVEPQHGVASINDVGELVFQPQEHFNGLDAISIRVFDGSVYSPFVTMELKVVSVNDRPIANDLALNGVEDNTLQGDLLGSDVEQAELSYLIVKDVEHGELTIGPGSSFNYVPDSNYFGEDDFQYIVSDGELNSEVAHVMIELVAVNDAPQVEILQPQANAIYEIGDDVTVNFNVSDVDNEGVTVRVLDGATVLTTVTEVADTFVLSGLAKGSYDIRVDANDGAILATSALRKIEVATAARASFVYTERRVAESNSEVIIPVQIDRVSQKPIILDFEVLGNGAESADYDVTSLQVEIPAGETRSNITINIKDDEQEEAIEGIDVKIIDASNADLGQYDHCEILIIDDDSDVPVFVNAHEEGLISELSVDMVITDPSGLVPSSLSMKLQLPDGQLLDVESDFNVLQQSTNSLHVVGVRPISTDGVYILHASIEDALGNVGVYEYQAEADVTAPSIEDFSLDPASPSSLANPVASFDLFDNRALDITSVRCSVINESNEEIQSEWEIVSEAQDNDRYQLTARCLSGLPNGESTIIVSVSDLAGNEGFQAHRYVRDGIIPKIVFTSPADRTWYKLGTESVTINGYVDEPVNLFYINYGVTPVTKEQVNGKDVYTFSYEVDLKPGLNAFHGTARDMFGNLGTANISFIVDDMPPQIHIESPVDNQLIDADAINVVGMIHDLVPGTVNPREVTVTVNGRPATVNNRTFMLNDLPLSNGDNQIVAIVSDAAGNTKSHEITVRKGVIPGIQLRMLSGNNQVAGIGQVLAQPFIVEAFDNDGNVLPNRVLSCQVARGSGYFLVNGNPERNVSLLTDVHGRVSIDFTVGTRSGEGNNRVIIKPQNGLARVEFSASVTPGPPSGIHVLEGHMQTSAVLGSFSKPLKVWVSDLGGNPLANATIDFAVVKGDATFSNDLNAFSVQTDSNGRASAFIRGGELVGTKVNTIEAKVRGFEDGFRPAVFSLSVAKLGSLDDTAFSGLCLDATGRPVSGAIITFMGTDISTVSDSTGYFTISGMPVGTHHLSVDGRTADIPNLPDMEYEIEIIPGIENSLPFPLYLPAMDENGPKLVGGPTQTELELPGVEGHKIIIHPNSLILPDGTRGQTEMVFSQVNTSAVPMPAPGGANPTIMTSLMPHGITFDPPATVVIPNTDSLPAGFQTNYMAFDHDLGQFVTVGTATVSEDMSSIVTDPGTGLVKAGWHGNVPPSPPTTEVENDEDQDDDRSKPECRITSMSLDKVYFEEDDNWIVASNGVDTVEVVIEVNVYCESGATYDPMLIAWSFDPKTSDSGIDILSSQYEDERQSVRLTLQGLSQSSVDYLYITAFYANKHPIAKRLYLKEPEFDVKLNAPVVNSKHIVLLNDSFSDVDAVPDFADGFSAVDFNGQGAAFDHADPDGSFPFIALEITIPPGIDRDISTVSFKYPQSRPNDVLISGDADSGFQYSIPKTSGNLRLWKIDGNYARNGASVHIPDASQNPDAISGDFIYSETVIPLATLLDTDIDPVSGAHFIVYVEGVKIVEENDGPNISEIEVSFSAVPEGGEAGDAVDEKEKILVSVVDVSVNSWEVDQLAILDLEKHIEIRGLNSSDYTDFTSGWSINDDSMINRFVFLDTTREGIYRLPRTREYQNYIVQPNLKLKVVGAQFPDLESLQLAAVGELSFPYVVNAPNIEEQLRAPLLASGTLKKVDATLEIIPDGKWVGNDEIGYVWAGPVPPPPYGLNTLLGAKGRVSIKSDALSNSALYETTMSRNVVDSDPVHFHGPDAQTKPGESNFIVSGHDIGAKLIQVYLKLSGTSSKSLLMEIPVFVDAPSILEPQSYQLEAAIQNARIERIAARTYNTDSYEEPQYIEPPEIVDKQEELAGKTLTQGITKRISMLEDFYLGAMFRASQIIPTRNSGGALTWNALFKRGPIDGLTVQSAASFADGDDARLYMNMVDLISVIHGERVGSEADAYHVIRELEKLSPGKNIYQRMAMSYDHNLNHVYESFDPRYGRNGMKAQVLGLEVRAKSLLTQAALNKLKVKVSLDKDFDKLIQTAITRFESAPLEERQRFSSIIDEVNETFPSDYSSMVNLLFPETSMLYGLDIRQESWHTWITGLTKDTSIKELINLTVMPEWSVGHAFTEELIYYMIDERMSLAEYAMDYIEERTNVESDTWPFRAYYLYSEDLAGFSIGDKLDVNRAHLRELPLRYDRNNKQFWPVTRPQDNMSNWHNNSYHSVLSNRFDGLGLLSRRDAHFMFLNTYYDTAAGSPTQGLGKRLLYRFEVNGKGRAYPISDTDIVAYIALLAMDEVAMLQQALDGKVREAFWQQYDWQFGPWNYAVTTVGSFLFGFEDIAKSWSGIDHETGAQLSSFERSLAVAFAVMSVVDPGVIASGTKKAVLGTVNASKKLRRTAASNLEGRVSKEANEVINLGLKGADEVGDSVRVLARAEKTTKTLNGGMGGAYKAASEMSGDALDAAKLRTHLGQFDQGSKLAANAGSRNAATRAGVESTEHGLRKLSGKELGKNASKDVKKSLDELGELNVHELHLFAEALEEGGSKAAEKIVREFRDIACFPAGTPVLMADGHSKPIESIHVGDLVLARSEYASHGPVESRQVIQTMSKVSKEVIYIQYRRVGNGNCVHAARKCTTDAALGDNIVDRVAGKNDEPEVLLELHVTPEHPFWSVDANGWVPAEDLSIDAIVHGLDYHWQVATYDVINEPVTVYNLTVEGAHTYFVGDTSDLSNPNAGAVWVHNKCTYDDWRKLAGKHLDDDGLRKALNLPDNYIVGESDWFSLYRKAYNDLLPGTPGFVTPGTAKQLRKNLESIGITPESGYQAHHILPTAVVTKGRSGDLMKKIGFITDHPNNGIPLPKRGQDADLPNHFFHNGYNEAVAESIEKIFDDAVASGINLNKLDPSELRQLRREVAKVQGACRHGIKYSKIPLIVKGGEEAVDEKAIKGLWREVIDRRMGW